MKRTKILIRKYFPDILILIGVLVVSYSFLRPVKYVCEKPCNRFIDYSGYVSDFIEFKMLGIFVISLGVIIITRRYFYLKN